MKIQSKRELDFQSNRVLNIKSPPEKFVSTICSLSESVGLLIVQQKHGSICATYCTKFSMLLLNCPRYLLDTTALPITIRAWDEPLFEPNIFYTRLKRLISRVEYEFSLPIIEPFNIRISSQINIFLFLRDLNRISNSF